MGGLTNLLRIGLLLAGLPMPRPIPLPSQQAVASRTSCPAAVAPRRWAPNIPGTLIRALSQRLGVDGIAAMRIALLYGDIEWQAAPASELRYSASDYARRMGIHRQTVQADLRRLEAIGAIGIDQDPSHGAVLQLHGLGCLSAEPCRSEHQPCRSDRHPPCRSEHHPPVDGVDNPLSMGSTTLEKGLKTQEKKREEKSNPNPNPSPPPEQTGNNASEPSWTQQPPEPLGPSSSEPGSKPNPEPKPGSRPEPTPASRPGSRPQPKPGSGSALPSRPRSGSSSKPETHALAPEPRQAAAALQPPGPTTAARGADGLLADLLDTFRSAAPAEWPRPGSLTLTPGRRSRLQGALAHAGGKQALQEHLRNALEHVPPWFRSTYPLRPDGSRRPSHQFFDLLFRASAAERDGGPEAWHVFAWSEAAERSARVAPSDGHSAPVEATASEGDSQRAQRLFGWGGSSWLMREIEALQLSLAERRRLTALLESQGQGTPGAGALQFSDPPEPPEPNPSPPPNPPMPR